VIIRKRIFSFFFFPQRDEKDGHDRAVSFRNALLSVKKSTRLPSLPLGEERVIPLFSSPPPSFQ